MIERIGTIRNDSGVDHIADLCTIATNTNSGEVWTVANLEQLMQQHGVGDYDEVRGLDFGVLMAILMDAEGIEAS